MGTPAVVLQTTAKEVYIPSAFENLAQFQKSFRTWLNVESVVTRVNSTGFTTKNYNETVVKQLGSVDVNGLLPIVNDTDLIIGQSHGTAPENVGWNTGSFDIGVAENGGTDSYLYNSIQRRYITSAPLVGGTLSGASIDGIILKSSGSATLTTATMKVGKISPAGVKEYFGSGVSFSSGDFDNAERSVVFDGTPITCDAGDFLFIEIELAGTAPYPVSVTQMYQYYFSNAAGKSMLSYSFV